MTFAFFAPRVKSRFPCLLANYGKAAKAKRGNIKHTKVFTVSNSNLVKCAEHDENRENNNDNDSGNDSDFCTACEVVHRKKRAAELTKTLSQEQNGNSASASARLPQPFFAISRAFVKSFRLSLLTIASYFLLMAPNFGEAFCAVPVWFLDTSNSALCRGDGDRVTRVVFTFLVRRALALLFVAARTAQPVLLMMSDKSLKKKIGDIVSDDSDN